MTIYKFTSIKVVNMYIYLCKDCIMARNNYHVLSHTNYYSTFSRQQVLYTHLHIQ